MKLFKRVKEGEEYNSFLNFKFVKSRFAPWFMIGIGIIWKGKLRKYGYRYSGAKRGFFNIKEEEK